MNPRLWGTARRVEWCYGFLRVRGVCWTWGCDQWVAGVTLATSSVAARAVELHAVATVHKKANREDGEVAELTAVT